MRYFVYARSNRENWSYEGRDEDAGILGSISPDSPPIAEGADLEEARLKGLAYLGSEPERSLRITDAEGRVYEILINSKHHSLLEKAERRLCIAIALLVFCVTTLVATVFIDTWPWALLCFVCILLCYVGHLKIGILNEVEAGLFCELILILILLLLPVWLK